jgi:hypothetical protein
MKREIAPEDVELVFSFHHKYHPREKLNAEKRKLIRRRLKEGYTIADLRTAIIGIHNTPHNLGDNERRTKYLGLHVSLRHENVDRFIETGEKVIERQERLKRKRRNKNARSSPPIAEKQEVSQEERDREAAEFRAMVRKELQK